MGLCFPGWPLEVLFPHVVSHIGICISHYPCLFSSLFIAPSSCHTLWLSVYSVCYGVLIYNHTMSEVCLLFFGLLVWMLTPAWTVLWWTVFLIEILLHYWIFCDSLSVNRDVCAYYCILTNLPLMNIWNWLYQYQICFEAIGLYAQIFLKLCLLRQFTDNFLYSKFDQFNL